IFSRDWSSDVCSSDLVGWRYSDFWQVWRIRLFSNALAALIVVPAILVWARTRLDSLRRASPARGRGRPAPRGAGADLDCGLPRRSEERRVGKESGTRT